MEIAVSAGSTVTIAHDDRLPRPAWLTKQFKPTGAKILVLGQSLSLFAHPTKKDASFTLGANTEDTRIKEAAMYIVFVNGSAAK
jgi:beta-galactosidase